MMRSSVLVLPRLRLGLREGSHMSKYEPLTDFLKNQITDEITLTFEDMADPDKIGITLPDSAKTYQQWWGNESTPTTRQCLAWLTAGWQVFAIDLTAEQITFSRLPATHP
jgi:hypothetical protein